MTVRQIDNIDDTFKIVDELLGAAAAGAMIRLTPLQAATVAQLITKNRTKAAPYLEAAVRQCGGRLHVAADRARHRLGRHQRAVAEDPGGPAHDQTPRSAKYWWAVAASSRTPTGIARSSTSNRPAWRSRRGSSDSGSWTPSRT